MNSKYSTSNQSTKKIENNFPIFAVNIVADLGLGIFLGICVNLLADCISAWFGLSGMAVIIIQVLIISVTLYFVKKFYTNTHPSWQGTKYGVVFIAVFLAVQQNMTHLFGKISIG